MMSLIVLTTSAVSACKLTVKKTKRMVQQWCNFKICSKEQKSCRMMDSRFSRKKPLEFDTQNLQLFFNSNGYTALTSHPLPHLTLILDLCKQLSLYSKQASCFDKRDIYLSGNFSIIVSILNTLKHSNKHSLIDFKTIDRR